MRHATPRLSTRHTAVATVVMACLLLVWSGDGGAGDAGRGRLLYENHCTVCHTSVVHVREQRKASTRDEIRSWIVRWQKELGLQWTSSEIDDVIEYLNDDYYKLKADS